MATLDTTTGLKVKTYSVAGPASYTTGGFLQDCSADFSTIKFIKPIVTTRGTLAICEYEINLDVDTTGAEAFGKAVIKLVRGRYDRATMGSPTGLPASTALQSALFNAGTTTGSSHNHTMNHGHGTITSAVETQSGTTGVLLAAGGGNSKNHTHNFTIASASFNTSSTTHAHNRPFEYDHSHTKTVATANTQLVEVGGAANLSTTTFTFIVWGFGRQ